MLSERVGMHSAYTHLANQSTMIFLAVALGYAVLAVIAISCSDSLVYARWKVFWKPSVAICCTHFIYRFIYSLNELRCKSNILSSSAPQTGRIDSWRKSNISPVLNKLSTRVDGQGGGEPFRAVQLCLEAMALLHDFASSKAACLTSLTGGTFNRQQR